MTTENRQGTINEQLTYWQGQKRHINSEGAFDFKLNGNPKTASPKHLLDKKQKDYIISSLEMELQILNYKNFTQYAKDVDHQRMVSYFRSSLQKRIIGCHITCQTFKGKWTLQSELHQIYNFNRSMISQVIKECIEEGWFISKICEDHSNQLCYRCNETVLKRTADYNIWKFKKGNNPKIVNFVKNYNNAVLDDILCKKCSNFEQLSY